MIWRIKKPFWRRAALVAFAPVLLLLYATFNVAVGACAAAWMTLQDIADSW